MKVWNTEERIKFKTFMSNSTENLKPKQSKLYGVVGINVTGESIINSTFNEPYFLVFGVFGVIILSTIIEQLLRVHGLDRWADSIGTLTQVAIPMSFYLFLCVGILTVF
jgi:hypothetical protein